MKKIFLNKKVFATLLAFTFLFSTSVAVAASSGPNNGSTFSNINIGNTDWLNPSNSQSSNNSYSTATLNSGSNRDSDNLKVTGFNFSIPLNATINGIEIEVERSASVANTIRTERVQMIKAGSLVGTAFDGSGDPYNWGASDAINTYGGSSSLWGTSWTPAQINASDFGLIFGARHSSGGANSSARVDNITVKVYYTAPATPTISLSSNISTSTPTNQDITITATTTGTGTLNTSSHTFTTNGSFSFVATNAEGQSTSTVLITNIDKVAPVIALNGSSTMTVEAGSVFVDPLATATDNIDVSLAITASVLNTNIAGVQILTYDTTDTAGNHATQITRTVNVVDTTAPVITSHSDLTFEAIAPNGATGVYTNPTASDIVDGSVSTVCNPTSGSTFALGTTTVTCSATDTHSNTASSTFIVTVTDTTAPVVSLNGSNTILVPIHTSYTELGATASDLVDGSVDATTTDTIDTNTLGTTTITYAATDTYGNTGSTTRNVVVVDVTAPVVDINSDIHTEASGPAGTAITFTSPSALDDVEGTSTATCTPASGSLFALGTTTVTCSATDTSGNVGTSTFNVISVDTVIPTIILSGDADVTIEGGSMYIDTGATANDNINGDITASIIPTSTVNTTLVGDYTVTYNVSDSSGNAAEPVVRTVHVIDTAAPIINITGSNPITVEGGSIYVDAGATATDNVATPVTVTSTSTVNTSVLGDYTVTYNAVDTSGNHASSTVRTVHVVDTTAPVIHVTGANPIIFTINNPYTELGATANDTVDGSRPVEATGTVDTATLGNYTITYTSTDLSGNTATTTRTVTVIPPDTTAPVITLLGSTPVTVEGGSTYTDAGATASDNVNGNMTGSIVRVNPVNTHAVGIYTITYNVTDGAGNAATEVTRTVNVVDTTAPVIILNGGDISLNTGASFTDPGATATDNVDTDIVVTVDGIVDTGATSTTVLTYNAVDTSGNHAIPVTRTVTVVDASVPVITLVGNNSVNVEVGSVYEDAGATATDDVDGDITSSIVKGGLPIDTSVLGTFTVTYNVTDSSENHAVQILRTVHVVDTTSPVVNLNGSSTVTVIQGGEYTELGATATDNYDVDPAPSVVVSGDVVASSTGTYIVTYTATDTSGNVGTTTRTVIVTTAPDTTAPVITLNGSSTMNVVQNTTFTDPGATASDNVDESVSVTVSGSVNIAVVGSYTLTYSAVDTAGNHATDVLRTVNVTAQNNNEGNESTSTSSTPTQPSFTGGFRSGGGSQGSGISTGGSQTAGGQVLGASTFVFTKNLRYGMNNNDVMELQKRLIAEGFLKVSATGYFGKNTLLAVKLYQAAHSIKPVSGFVGPLTRAELNK